MCEKKRRAGFLRYPSGSHGTAELLLRFKRLCELPRQQGTPIDPDAEPRAQGGGSRHARDSHIYWLFLGHGARWGGGTAYCGRRVLRLIVFRDIGPSPASNAS